ncbi:stalk domain-containing protein [Cohnella cholangitidis]|uniref:stalk domain-containing protein n=1 Tax=Cohnella cholangitidis TaxID=2598458 RepID=UPI0015FD0848|nr:stalk domain-containing protein [Cohnella cholangitidis]
MRIKFRSFLLLIGALSCLLLGMNAAGAQSQSLPLSLTSPLIALNNESVSLPSAIPAEVSKGRAFVPVRFFQHPQIQGDYIFSEDKGTYYLLIDNHAAEVNLIFGKGAPLFRITDSEGKDSLVHDTNALPYLHGEEPMVPLRLIAEALGLQVKWDNQAKSVILETDEEYRRELYSVEEWEAQMGEYPVYWDDKSAKPITDEELQAYIEENKLPIVDYKIDSKYKAIVLEVKEHETSTYAIHRLRNGKLGKDDIMVGTKENEYGFAFQKFNGYLSIVLFDKAKLLEIHSCVVSIYDNRQTKKLKVEIGDKRGYLLRIGEEVSSGLVNLKGKDGYTYEEIFW